MTHHHKAIAATGMALLLAACSSSDPDTATDAGAPSTIEHERPTSSVDELVAVTDGRMHIRCSGSGDATVLLIAGWDQGSDAWAAVEPAIADETRVCAYDRFGTGTSDAPSTPQTFDDHVTDLHELLEKIDEPGPYVVVGHSFGGATAATFASTYSDDVAGLMLLDPSPRRWPYTVCSVPAYAGGCALMREPTQGERLDVFPAFDGLARIDTLRALPMTVVSAAHRSAAGLAPEEVARLDAVWAEGTEDWAQLSTRSSIITLEDVGHEIQAERPDLVIAEVTKLLE